MSTPTIKMATDKQKNIINKIISKLGVQRVKAYFDQQFPFGDYDDMTRREAQKIITGLARFMPIKPIPGVHQPSWI